ncbi:MAG: hypothetical protein RLY31_2258 [Bacteroidota bacterium]
MQKINYRILVSGLLWMTIGSPADLSAQTFVRAGATGNNDGSSWQHAYADLAVALANTTGGEIWVAAGTYKPGDVGADSSATFLVSQPVSLYGGFTGNETSVDQRNPAANPTILSGDINGDDLAENFSANKSDNVQHVIYVDSLAGGLVRIDGFHIIGGHTSNVSTVAGNFRSGGGIYALQPVDVRNCEFYNNFGRSGACMMLNGGAAGSTVADCTFRQNYATSQSAGILVNYSANVTVEGCTFDDNQSTRGTLYVLGSDNVTVDACQFTFNVNVDGAGAAFYNFNGTNVQLTDCLFQGNVAVNSGAVYYDATDVPGSDPSNFVLSSCIFRENSTSGGIGGAFRNRNGSYTLQNCVFEGNTATGSGGQIRNDTDGDQVVYQGCTFRGGTSGGWGGAHTCYGAGSYILQDCQYEENTTTNLGGAMNCGFKAIVTIDGCTFSGNVSLNSAGGAIALQNDSTTLIVTNSEFSSNNANSSGGAIFSGASTSSSVVSVDNSQFWANETIGGVGGAISVAENGDDDIGLLELSNSMFGFNIAPAQGGAVNMTDCDAVITSSLFFSNFAGDIGTGGAISNNTTDSNHVEVVIHNVTFADNFGELAAGIANWTGQSEATSNMRIQNCIFRQDGAINYAVEDGFPNLVSTGGNLSDDTSLEAYLLHPKDIQLEDPSFVDPDDFDYRLQLGSICIDAGVDDGAPATDLDGNPRINGVDMGAYENQDVVKVREKVLLATDEWQVWPNPAVGRQVSAQLSNEWTGRLHLACYDLTGRLIRDWEPDKSGQRLVVSLDLAGLRPGMYDLVVSDGTGALRTRLVKL